ncbi:MAG: glycoside hydrolase family 3 C-terminal domain-containing protein [Tannerella sp.]|nr:glycoside hydrolase family 3 C-terminal domain-containing protein [Tannerella sp.]
MKKNVILFPILCCIMAITACHKKNAYEYPFQNPDLSVEERVDDLLGRLTVEEKVGQMMNATPAIERLGIPEYDWWNEALHGVARAGRATVFPQSIAMAATFDEDALLKTFTMVSDEARAKYHNYQKEKEYDRYKGLTFWTPNINIFRDPRWGRGMETYGEDPYLTSRLGLAVVKGLQGDDPKYLKSHACAKHYAVHSGPEWNRHEFDAVVSPRDLYLTYLPAFETLVREGNVQEVMCAYNRYEGTPCCGSNKLLVNILREDWGYDNIIVSDCGAIDDFWKKDKNTPRHETHPDRESASIAAVRTGTDLECGASYRALLDAVKNGTIKEEELDISLRRLFKGRFGLGLLDPDDRVPYASIPYAVVESPEHIAQSLEMARKSMVLLKNGTSANGNILPLSKNIKKIAVIGPNAADSTMLWANYNGFPTHTVTLLEGICTKMPDAEIIYELGCNHTDNIMFNDLGNHITSGGQTGLTAEFFNNAEFDGEPVYKGIVSNIHYTTGGNTQFAPNVNLTNFTARFAGDFESPIAGDITFRLAGNDGFRMFIGNDTVMKLWTNEYGGGKSYTLKAEKGKKYPLTIEYIQKTGSADLNFEIGYYKPVDPAETAAKVKDADVIIFAGGLSPRLEGEEMPVFIDGFKKGDRTDIELPSIQREMLKALKATGKPVIFVVCTGSALALTWEHENVDAILNAWYGGQTAGTAVADILFGDYNPSGKLPVTFYKSTSQLPDFENYDMKGRTYRYMTENPLYPFGYGLSYTTFAFDNASLSSSEITSAQNVTLTIPVKNTGDTDGEEVVQVYIKNPNDPDGPVKALKGFCRIPVKAGSTANAVITLEPNAFSSFNDAKQIPEIRPGRYDILYGNSSDDKDLKHIELILKSTI